MHSSKTSVYNYHLFHNFNSLKLFYLVWIDGFGPEVPNGVKPVSVIFSSFLVTPPA